MIRAIKILSYVFGISLLLLLGGAIAVFFSSNTQWIAISFPYPRLSFAKPFGSYTFEATLGVLAAGWCVSLFIVAGALILFPLYLRKTRQYLKTIRGLEKELVALRNLPFKAPAPLEDLPDEAVHEPDPDPFDSDEALVMEDEAPAGQPEARTT